MARHRLTIDAPGSAQSRFERTPSLGALTTMSRFLRPAVPRLIPDVAMVAGFAATRSEDLVDPLRITPDVINDGCGVRITPATIMRLRATGEAIIDAIDGFGLGSNLTAARAVVAVPPSAT